jgi:hypothetical protein
MVFGSAINLPQIKIRRQPRAPQLKACVMLTEVSAIDTSPTAFVMPLLRTAARTRIRFHNVVDPFERLPPDWKQPHHAAVMVVIAAWAGKGTPELPPEQWAIVPWLSVWFRTAHVLPVPVATADLHEAVEAALINRRMVLVLTSPAAVQPWVLALCAGRQGELLGHRLGEAA